MNDFLTVLGILTRKLEASENTIKSQEEELNTLRNTLDDRNEENQRLLAKLNQALERNTDSVYYRLHLW
jgi:uncharacterized protein YhaN